MRQRRFSFQEALRQLQITSDDVDSDSNAEATSSSECESIPDVDELPLEEEELSDIDVFEEEIEDDETGSDADQESNDGSLEDEDLVPITAGNATYYANTFPGKLRRRNILMLLPELEVDAFKLFYRPEIILQIVRETNRKARDV
ncbi:unnamed protein product [Clavelina lepadiformis]|uniref:Uncharacterized protein n=1 Tax=Clavelina lepadiformis TaxID=159417 RepID=A0ABP0GB40_CLALP